MRIDIVFESLYISLYLVDFIINIVESRPFFRKAAAGGLWRDKKVAFDVLHRWVQAVLFDLLLVEVLQVVLDGCHLVKFADLQAYDTSYVVAVANRTDFFTDWERAGKPGFELD